MYLCMGIWKGGWKEDVDLCDLVMTKVESVCQ